ncbi:hypothetical protein EJB05_03190, partial [Eragrostis curvula]
MQVLSSVAPANMDCLIGVGYTRYLGRGILFCTKFVSDLAKEGVRARKAATIPSPTHLILSAAGSWPPWPRRRRRPSLTNLPSPARSSRPTPCALAVGCSQRRLVHTSLVLVADRAGNCCSYLRVGGAVAIACGCDRDAADGARARGGLRSCSAAAGCLIGRVGISHPHHPGLHPLMVNPSVFWSSSLAMGNTVQTVNAASPWTSSLLRSAELNELRRQVVRKSSQGSNEPLEYMQTREPQKGDGQH